MIMWGKLDSKMLLTEILGIEKTDKTISLGQSLAGFENSEGLQYPSQVKLWAKKILKLLKPTQPIHTLTVADANKVFDAIFKQDNEATAYRCRSTIINAIDYSLTGKLPEVKTPFGNNGRSTDDIGKLKFSKAKIADIQHMVPLYSTNGRFGWVKAEVQRQLYALAPGEAGVIEAPKRSMTDKEAKSLVGAVDTMFRKGKLPWIIKYNPNNSVFILLRKSDFEKLFPKPIKGA